MIERNKSISLILIGRLMVLGVFSWFFSQSLNVQQHDPFDVMEGDAEVIRRLEMSAFNSGDDLAPLQDASAGGPPCMAKLFSTPFIFAFIEVESRPFLAIILENPPHAPPVTRPS